MRRELHARPLRGEWHVVAIGKAAGAMTLGALDSLGARVVGGLVVTKPGHVPSALDSHGALRILESAHPQPDERSLAAGAAALEFVTALRDVDNVLYLISGGASSLVEHLVPGVGLDDLQRVNAWALAGGSPIGEVNAVRRALSLIKGGGLAVASGRRAALALMISDVPRDDPAVIGSGLLRGPPGPDALPGRLPPDIARILERAGRGAAPKASVDVPARIIASVRSACRAAAARACDLGLAVRPARARFSGDAARLGARFARTVLDGPAQTLHIWGGESTMTLPPEPGYGGRNQHLALSAATVLAGRGDAVVLAAGTDGIDGVTADAGAIVDAGTVGRGSDGGFDLGGCLARADSGRFLEAAGDLLHTGPTLTNVGDIVLGLRGCRAG